jgi:hypothetical protein
VTPATSLRRRSPPHGLAWWAPGLAAFGAYWLSLRWGFDPFVAVAAAVFAALGFVTAAALWLSGAGWRSTIAAAVGIGLGAVCWAGPIGPLAAVALTAGLALVTPTGSATS